MAGFAKRCIRKTWQWQQCMLLAMAPVQPLCPGFLLNIQQGHPNEDTLLGPVQIKSQDTPRAHTQSEDLGSPPRTFKLDRGFKAPEQLERNGV